MMAKYRKFRQTDWNETLRDISNARSEMMPQGSLPDDVLSTVKRSPLRGRRLEEAALQPVIQAPVVCRAPSNLRRKLALATAVGALVLAAGWGMFHLARKTEIPAVPEPLPAPQSAEVGRAPPPVDRERAAMEQYDEITSWAKAHPSAHVETITRFRKLAEDAVGTKYAEMAKDDIRQIEQRGKKTAEIIVELDKKAGQLADRGRFQEAAAVYGKYHGAFETETAAERGKKERLFSAKHADRVKAQRRQRELAELQLMHAADEIAVILVEDDLEAARQRIKALAVDLPLISGKPEFKAMAAMLEKSSGAGKRIMDSFQRQKNEEISIAFLQGPQTLHIRDVQGDVVLAEKVVTMEEGKIGLQKIFRARDLTLSEKLNRLGAGAGPEFALMRAMLAIQDGDYQQAADAAAGTGPLLAPKLAAAIKCKDRDTAEERATQTLAYIMCRTGIIPYHVRMPDPASCLDILRDKNRFPQNGPAAGWMIDQFRVKFGSTQTARRYAAVLEALAGSAGGLAASTQTGTEAALPPDQTSEKSIIEQMMTKNPGLGENQMVFQTDNSGRIVSADIVSVHLKDIQPLESLPHLKTLVCAGTRLHVWPEMSMPAQLSDLTPLKQMSLSEFIGSHTRIRDISVLSRMPLTSLNLARTRVGDLQPLKDMPLRQLDVSFTQVRDLRPLAGLPLVNLNINGTDVSNLGALLGMPLKTLSAAFTRARDLTPLRAMPLIRLVLRGTDITDIAPLQGMPLESLDLSDTNVRDILPLQGMRLRDLDLRNTKVKDISVLENMPLEALKLNGSAVKNIAPLKNTPLKMLDLRDTSIADLTPLENLPVEEIWLDVFDNQERAEKTRGVLAILHKMPRLRIINGAPLWDWKRRGRR
jgi:Leucine-rich repeat (LRR) protein